MYTKDSFKREGNGSESIGVGGTNPSTKPFLANEQGNIDDENGDSETYGHDEIHAKVENSTANDIRGQVSITENAGDAKESNVNGHADQDTKPGDAGDVSQSADGTLVQGNGPQVAASNNSTSGIHGDGVATHETTSQREGEGSGNKRVEVTPSTEEDAGLDNADGSPSGNGENEDEDLGSGNDEGPEAGDGKGGHDDSKGQENQSHQGRDDNRGQSSISSEGDDSKEKDGSPNGCDGDNTSSSEENNGIEEGNGGQAIQENQKLSHKDNRDTEGGITCQSKVCPLGKSQGQVSFETDSFLWQFTFPPLHSDSWAKQQKQI